MYSLLFWLYLGNAVFLVVHEIDSAYFREWELFGMKGGITLFLVLHFPLIFLVLLGLVFVFEQRTAGYILSLAMSVVGIGAFGLHLFFIARGRKEFRTKISLFILGTILIVSIVQGVLTMSRLAT